MPPALAPALPDTRRAAAAAASQVAFELVRVGELLSAPLAALGRWVHPAGAVLGGTAEFTQSEGRRGLFARV